MNLWPESICHVSLHEPSDVTTYSVINRFPPFLLEKDAVTVFKLASVFRVLYLLESPELLISLLDLSVTVSKDQAGSTDRGRPIPSKLSAFFLFQIK